MIFENNPLCLIQIFETYYTNFKTYCLKNAEKERQRLMHVVDEDVDLRPYFIRDTILEENYAVGDGVSLDGN